MCGVLEDEKAGEQGEYYQGGCLRGLARAVALPQDVRSHISKTLRVIFAPLKNSLKRCCWIDSPNLAKH